MTLTPTKAVARKDSIPNSGLVQDRQQPSPKIRAYYSQTIQDYQTWSRQGYMHFGIWKRWINPLNRRRMLEAMNDLVFAGLQLHESRNLKIADLGCGTAAVSRYGARQFPSHHWLAATICPEQVSYGQSGLDPLDQQRIEIHQADFCELPVANSSLDAAFFLESLCHADHPLDPLKEVARVLKPGGRLVVVDGMMHRPPSETPGYANWLSRKTAENWAVGEFHNVPQFEKAVSSSGLRIQNRSEVGWQLAPCVAHSPVLIGWHSLRLLLTGKLTAWKRKHMVGCALGIFLGLMRHQFGYYVYTISKPN